MVRRAGANKLHTTATQISVHIKDSRHDMNVLHSLKGLDEVTHHAPLTREDEEWLIQNRIIFSVSTLIVFPLTFALPYLPFVQCTYGTTEVPLILTSARDAQPTSSTIMRPIDPRSVAFVPVSSSGYSSSTLPSSAYTNVHTNVSELVIRATSPDCPHPSMRQPEDGHFHTGDLFLEVLPGQYTFRGRITEWIRNSTGILYDAKYVGSVPFVPFAILGRVKPTR